MCLLFGFFQSLSASRHSNSLEELNQNKTSSVTAVTGSASQVLVKYNDEHVANGGTVHDCLLTKFNAFYHSVQYH